MYFFGAFILLLINVYIMWCETNGAVNPQSIIIVSYLVILFIPHDGGLLVAQLFLWIMVVSLLYITCVPTVLVCM